ncbi:MAG: magnesium chelatase [Crocinitomicaceae bacterium]
MKLPQTLGELKKSGYQSKSIQLEMRDNLIAAIQSKKDIFEGIIGYEDTVIPDIERAILSGHNMNLLGLRGQAKTRIARQLTGLLDEYTPIIEGSELNDDPLAPISQFGKEKIAELGDKTPIAWLHRDQRYVEKLATPDVSVADLIGDIDPIKAANLKLSYSDYRVIHYGIIPRSNRCIFVINELPDLQARIQVALFNILQEGDVQIRGYQLRIPLDMKFVFTANPEDYTNRGSIITPLKDRIGSQILTHYPTDIHIGKKITAQEAKLTKEQRDTIVVPDKIATLIERLAFMARSSEFVDAKSGVSARLTISAYEALVSTIERRMLVNKEKKGFARISDLQGVLPAINGKVELVYEGEQEGAGAVAQHLVSSAIKEEYLLNYPNPKMLKKQGDRNPMQPVQDWFSSGNHVDVLLTDSKVNYEKALKSVVGLENFVKTIHPELKGEDLLLEMEFALYGMAEHSLLLRNHLVKGAQFKDLVGSIFSEEDFFKGN